MLGLYTHIPFCIKKCHYCNFVITTRSGDNAGEIFLEALRKEISRYAGTFKKNSFDTLYIGGGTPSALSQGNTEKLFKLLRKNFRFKKNAEITWEANPGDVDLAKAREYKRLGINRVSLGAQSFNDAILKGLNRTHQARDIYRSFEALRKAGIMNINMDLMLSLPGQTGEDIKEALKATKVLSPEHVSVYELVIEKNTVFSRRFEKGILPGLPSEKKEIQFLKQTRQGLKKLGYTHYELLNYAKPGYESRHNQLYWKNEPCLGLGPGAFSYIDGKRFQYADSVDNYFKKINSNDRRNFEEENLSPEKALIESLLLSLRLLVEGAKMDKFQCLPFEQKTAIERLLAKRLLLKRKGALTLSPKGQLLAESVFAELA